MWGAGSISDGNVISQSAVDFVIGAVLACTKAPGLLSERLQVARRRGARAEFDGILIEFSPILVA
jgi:hypothetical protein